MIERALKLRRSLDFIALGKDLRDFEIDETGWEMIGICLKVLEPFAMATKKIDSATLPTLSVVIPLLNYLITQIVDWESANYIHPTETIDAAKVAKAKLLNYYHKTNEAYVVVFILDPCLKVDYFQDNNWEEDLIMEEISPS